MPELKESGLVKLCDLIHEKLSDVKPEYYRRNISATVETSSTRYFSDLFSYLDHFTFPDEEEGDPAGLISFYKFGGSFIMAWQFQSDDNLSNYDVCQLGLTVCDTGGSATIISDHGIASDGNMFFKNDCFELEIRVKVNAVDYDIFRDTEMSEFINCWSTNDIKEFYGILMSISESLKGPKAINSDMERISDQILKGGTWENNFTACGDGASDFPFEPLINTSKDLTKVSPVSEFVSEGTGNKIEMPLGTKLFLI